MAGIYLHIPFCKQACHYCNFHFSTSLKRKEEMVLAIGKELELQKNYLKGAELKSIYFGGGTPSLLNEKELAFLLEKIGGYHQIAEDAEITLEANPDDISSGKLEMWKRQSINRLSIGIQSFSEEDLSFMNRAHNASEARNCIDLARSAGFTDLTADLIYGSPTTSDKQWAENIEIMLNYGLPHISAYCLTVEPRTALDHFVRKGKVPPVDEQKSARQYEYLQDRLAEAGYVHYEISNFALPGREAKHNSSYWLGQPYLGVGPSAHSFNGQSRQWNVANNAKYLKALSAGKIPFELEEITSSVRYDEYVMTRLRTIWGCSMDDLTAIGPEYAAHFQGHIGPFIEKGWIEEGEDGIFRLTRAGRLVADYVSGELFY
jgi:oxygen-independent coproporphyrinogen-3 oxidase